MKKLLGFVLIGLIIQSCSAPVLVIPNDVLSQDKMVAVLTDVHLVESAITLKFSNKDTSKVQASAYYDFIYKSHKTTKEQFAKSYDFYISHPELLNKIYDEVLIELSKKQGELAKKK